MKHIELENNVDTLVLGQEKRDKVCVVTMETPQTSDVMKAKVALMELEIPEDFYERSRGEMETLSSLLPTMKGVRVKRLTVRCIAEEESEAFESRVIEEGVESGFFPAGADFLFLWDEEEEEVPEVLNNEHLELFWYANKLEGMRTHFVIRNSNEGVRFRSINKAKLGLLGGDC